MKNMMRIILSAALFIAMSAHGQLGKLMASTTRYVDPAGSNTSPYTTPATAAHNLQDAINASSAGDAIEIAAATFAVTATININVADLTITGAGSANTIFTASISVTGVYAFNISASGVTLQDIQIEKTDKTGTQNLILVNGNNVSIKNNLIFGKYVLGDGDVSRALEVAVSKTGLLVDGNTIHSLRQPAYLNPGVTGTISNNYVAKTRGWVVDNADLTFSNNTWGTGADVNYLDIAILSSTNAAYYTDLVGLSDANNNAIIEDQRPTTRVLTIVHVDDDAASGGDGTITRPYQTVSAAVPRCVTGGDIIIAAGDYPENVTVDKRLYMTGAGSGSNPSVDTILLPSSPGITITAGGASAVSRLVISNMMITGATGGGNTGSGILIQQGAATIKHITFDNVACVSNSGHGIAINHTGTVGDIEVLNSTLSNNGEAGFRIPTSIASFDGLKIDNCQIDDNGVHGLITGASGSPNVTNIDVSNTDFSGNGTPLITGHGDISMFQFNGNASFTNVTLTGDGSHVGLQLRGKSSPALAPCGTVTFDNVTITGSYQHPTTWVGAGMIVSYYSDVSGISMNNVSINVTPVSPAKPVINLYTDTMGGALDLNDMTLGGNANADILNLSVGTIDATGATFTGAADNFAIEDRVVHAVDLSGVGLVTWNPNNLYVTPNSFAAPTTTTPDIQRAVAVAGSGFTVHVAAGTYPNLVTITQNLTLIGAGAATTIIKAPATIPAASNVTSSVVDINGSGITVDLSGFTVSGPGPTGCGSIGAGIFVRGGAHADIHDNKILDIRDEPISGCQNGIGIIVGRVSFSEVGTATITDNEISGYQKGGIVVSNVGSYAEISGNTVTGAGAVNFIAQNGIQVSGGATGDINGNTVSGHSYTPFTFVATGMLLYQSDANTDDNDVLENQVGVYHIEGSGLHQNNSVSASAVGTGSPFFWGMVADPGDVPRVLPDPLDGLVTANNAVQSKQKQNTIAATYTQTYDQNVLTGDGSASGIGLEGDVYGTDVLDFTATANTITGWAWGVTFYKDGGATLIANVINCNQIYDNGIGLDNPTGVVVNAVGNWWGDASGPAHTTNPGGTGNAVSDDVTFTPWGTTSSCGTSIGSDLVFKANGSISIERTKQTPSRGWIHSNGTVTFKRGDPSTYEVDITAVGKVTIVGDENTIDGDVFTANTIANNEGSVITGAAVSGAAISPMALPSLSYSAGGANHTIAKGKSLTLAPGSYGTVTINKSATLKLSSGTYHFTKLLNSGSDATIIFDVASGPITINVVSSLTIAKDMEFRVVPDGENGSEKVTVNTMQTAKLSIGGESYLLGDINAPYATVSLGNNSQFRGTLRANSIEILRDCLWYGHNSTGTLPGPDLLPKFEADENEASSEVVTSYELEQNYPNPFNPSTTIRFGLVERGNVRVEIYNSLGQVVRTLAQEAFAAGRHELTWDGRNHNGELVATGSYLYRVEVRNAGGATIFSETRSMTFLK